MRMGKQRKSSILIANGKHTLTDCWTGIAVVVGVGLVLLTKWAPFDSICGLLLAGNILWTGSGLVKSAYSGLMDEAPPDSSDALLQLRELLLVGAAPWRARRGLYFFPVFLTIPRETTCCSFS